MLIKLTRLYYLTLTDSQNYRLIVRYHTKRYTWPGRPTNSYYHICEQYEATRGHFISVVLGFFLTIEDLHVCTEKSLELMRNLFLLKNLQRAKRGKKGGGGNLCLH